MHEYGNANMLLHSPLCIHMHEYGNANMLLHSPLCIHMHEYGNADMLLHSPLCIHMHGYGNANMLLHSPLCIHMHGYGNANMLLHSPLCIHMHEYGNTNISCFGSSFSVPVPSSSQPSFHSPQACSSCSFSYDCLPTFIESVPQWRQFKHTAILGFLWLLVVFLVSCPLFVPTLFPFAPGLFLVFLFLRLLANIHRKRPTVEAI